MVDAANCRITTSLFPIEDLIHITDIGISKYLLQPLYTGDVIQYYYPLLETIFTIDAVIVFKPFKFMDTSNLFELNHSHSRSINQS